MFLVESTKKPVLIPRIFVVEKEKRKTVKKTNCDRQKRKKKNKKICEYQKKEIALQQQLNVNFENALAIFCYLIFFKKITVN
ncbi:MAG: hypothetical protein RLZZ292_2556, partial [Bacteroidota bacterium]